MHIGLIPKDRAKFTIVRESAGPKAVSKILPAAHPVNFRLARPFLGRKCDEIQGMSVAIGAVRRSVWRGSSSGCIFVDRGSR